MASINTYYRFIAWCNILAASTGCSYHSKNDRMDHPSTSQESVVNQRSNAPLRQFDDARELDDLLAEIDILSGKLKKHCWYIEKHRTNYTITSMANEMHIILSEIGSMDDATIAQETSSRFSLLQTLLNLNQREKAHAKTLNTLFCNQLMQTTVIEQITNSSGAEQDKEIKTYMRLYEAFLDEVEIYLKEHLLPYWGTIVKWLILRALKISVAQGETLLEEAEKNYQNACEAIESSYNENSIEQWENFLNIAMQQGKQHSPVETIHKLEQCWLKPTKAMYAKLNVLIRNIKYNNDAVSFLQKARDSLTMFYNILYAFGITDLLSILGIKDMDQPKPDVDLVEEYMVKILKKETNVLRLKVHLADFIKGKHTDLNQINSKIQEFTNYSINLLKPTEAKAKSSEAIGKNS